MKKPKVHLRLASGLFTTWTMCNPRRRKWMPDPGSTFQVSRVTCLNCKRVMKSKARKK